MRAVATREFPFIPLEAIRAAGLELSAALSMGRTEVGAARDRYQSRIFPPGFTGIRYLVVGGRFDRAAKRALPAINASIVEGRTRWRPLSLNNMAGRKSWSSAICRILSSRHLDRIAQLFQAGAIRPPEIKLYRLSEAADAHRLSESRHFRGKLVFQVAW